MEERQRPQALWDHIETQEKWQLISSDEDETR